MDPIDQAVLDRMKARVDAAGGHAYDSSEACDIRGLIEMAEGRAASAGEARLRAERARDPDYRPEGTVEALATCATMLETWGPECLPVNEHGKVHFARAMMDGTAAEIRAYLAARPCQAAEVAG